MSYNYYQASVEISRRKIILHYFNQVQEVLFRDLSCIELKHNIFTYYVVFKYFDKRIYLISHESLQMYKIMKGLLEI